MIEPAEPPKISAFDETAAVELRRHLLAIVRMYERLGGTHTLQIQVVRKH